MGEYRQIAKEWLSLLSTLDERTREKWLANLIEALIQQELREARAKSSAPHPHR